MSKTQLRRLQDNERTSFLKLERAEKAFEQANSHTARMMAQKAINKYQNAWRNAQMRLNCQLLA